MTSAARSLPSDDFVSSLESCVRSRFDSKHYPQENLPSEGWELLTRAGVLLPAIPKEYGGRDSHVELCRLIERISEHNLPLGMYTMIITACFLRSIARSGSFELKQEVLPRFAREPLIGGFAMTEPGCGSAMARMTTTYEEVPGGYRIRGRKHWQGFSSTAHWWLVLARSADPTTRSYGYFVVERTEGFKTIERYSPLGLKAIDYGLNEIDAVVPKHRRLHAESRDLSAAVEMLGPPRFSMAALATGFLKRIYREARAWADHRYIGPARLSDIGFARYRLTSIETSRTICEAAFQHLLTCVDFRQDMQESFLATLASKTLCTERMLSSALHYQQLCGGEGFRHGAPSNIAAQALLDSRAFTIFDGTNDLLDQQLAEHCLREANGARLSEAVARQPLVGPALRHVDPSFLDRELGQEHLVLAGRALAAMFGIAQLMHYGEGGQETARRAHVAIEFLKAELRGLAAELDLLDAGWMEPSPPVSRSGATVGLPLRARQEESAGVLTRKDQS